MAIFSPTMVPKQRMSRVGRVGLRLALEGVGSSVLVSGALVIAAEGNNSVVTTEAKRVADRE